MALNESSGQTLREKMVYMSVGDSHHNQGNHGELFRPNKSVIKVNVSSFLVLYMLGSSTGGSKVTDEVYMEVVVGGEEPVTHDRSYDSVSLSKDFMPVAWAAAYGQHPCLLNCFETTLEGCASTTSLSVLA